MTVRLNFRKFFDSRENSRDLSPSDLAFLHAMLVSRETAHLTRPCPDAIFAEKMFDITPSDLKQRYRSRPANPVGLEWMIERDSALIGSASIVLDPSHRMTPGDQVAWLGLELASSACRRKGFGTHTLGFLEEQARGLQAIWAEVGVFEFNQASFLFFSKNGYHPIGQRPRATWWQGRYWSGHRLAKKL